MVLLRSYTITNCRVGGYSPRKKTSLPVWWGSSGRGLKDFKRYWWMSHGSRSRWATPTNATCRCCQTPSDYSTTHLPCRRRLRKAWLTCFRRQCLICRKVGNSASWKESSLVSPHPDAPCTAKSAKLPPWSFFRCEIVSGGRVTWEEPSHYLLWSWLTMCHRGSPWATWCKSVSFDWTTTRRPAHGPRLCSLGWGP